MRPQSPPFGSLKIGFSNILYYQLILKILEDINEVLKNDKMKIIYYLQGIIAGEGHIKPGKHKSLNSVRIGCSNAKEKLFYHILLKKLGIKSHIAKNQIEITGQDNFLKLFKCRLIDLHPKKYLVFLNSFLKFRQISLKIKKEFLKEKENIKKELSILNIKRGDYHKTSNLV